MIIPDHVKLEVWHPWYVSYQINNATSHTAIGAVPQ